MATAEAALERLCDPEAEVSAHYLIRRDGEVLALVPEELRAWHAGAGSWGNRGDVNSRSIGIEIDNDGSVPFSAPAMAALEPLLAGVLARWNISPRGVIGHSDMAPTRKIDPGPRFDWRRLACLGLAVWPPAPVPMAPDPELFLADAAVFGYPVADGLDPVLATLRARFRPGAGGPLDPFDMGLAADLALRFPVDRVPLAG